MAPIPAPTELPGQPFAIKKTWVIGGTGNWDYLTLDPAARQLFVTHQSRVQVVDVDSGEVTGQVSGLGEAHAVVLDPSGDTGYVSDSRANMIRIFDRSTFQVTGKVPVGSSPRALVFEPQSGMLFAFGALPTPAPPAHADRTPSRNELDPCSAYGDINGSGPPPPAYTSLVSIIDPGKQSTVADIEVCGILGGAQADGGGHVYFTIANFNTVGRLNASAILNLIQAAPADLRRMHGTLTADGTLLLDFRTSIPGAPLRLFRLGQECEDPRALAIDAKNARLFTACSNMALKVIATDTGNSVAALTIGPGVDAMAYDAGRGLIYTANGGGYGSVTIVRRHLTDDYAVIQNLPTMQQARTMAVDPSTGLLYLVTTLYGANLASPPVNGIGTLKLKPVEGSFQVLVIGN